MNNTSNLYYTPYVSVYEFFKLFFIILDKKEITKGEIVKNLYKAKCTGEYNNLLGEFVFFNNGLFISSEQVENGIYQMIHVGICQRNNHFGKLAINTNDIDIDKIKKETNIILMNEMTSLIDMFFNKPKGEM